MRRCLGISLVLATFAGPVEAADWQNITSQNGWNRFYVGINGGYGWGRGRADATFGATSFSGSTDLPGAVAGGQIGFNRQFDSIVLGIEADLQWSGQENSSVVCAAAVCGTSVTLATKIPWFGTIRGRLGGTMMERVLVYATGGLSFGGARVDASWPGVGTARLSDTWIGWTIGAGAEVPFAGRWTAKIEYLYLDTGTISELSIAATGFGTAAFEVAGSDHILRVGINYHF